MKSVAELEKERGAAARKVAALEQKVADLRKKITPSEAKRMQLVEGFQAMGLTEAEAQIAAGTEAAFKDGDVNRIFEAGLALGLSQKEAAIFADPTSTPAPTTDRVKALMARGFSHQDATLLAATTEEEE